MIFFSQRKPKAFDYKPRYYDPEKERREQRRRELCGLDTYTPNEEYKPGMYLRNQVRERRSQHISRDRDAKRNSTLRLAVILALLVLVVYLMFFR